MSAVEVLTAVDGLQIYSTNHGKTGTNADGTGNRFACLPGAISPMQEKPRQKEQKGLGHLASERLEIPVVFANRMKKVYRLKDEKIRSMNVNYHCLHVFN